MWFKIDIWKLKGMREGSEKGRCRLFSGEEDAIHVLLTGSETKRKEQVFTTKNRVLLVKKVY
jgi:hypothetical protein